MREDDFLYVLDENPPEELREKVDGCSPHLPEERHLDRGLSSVNARLPRR